MGIGLAGRPPCMCSQTLMGVVLGRDLPVYQSDPYGGWVSWETSMPTSQALIWVMG